MKQIFKTIEEALPVLRPGDKLVKKLSNKFAWVQSVYENGTYGERRIMGLQNEKIYSYHSNYRDIENYLLRVPNISRELWCFDHSKNGKSMDWLVKTRDFRTYKRQLRKLLTLI